MTMLAAAVELAGLGYRVFPLAPGDKVPLISKDDGGRGFHDATVDVDRITSWWTRCPTANIGIATGHLADGTPFSVIDLDEHSPHESGNDAWAELVATFGTIDTVEATTATGNGRHLYVRTDGVATNASGSNFPAGIDVRGEGGYVVAPPSRTPKGAYAWDAMSDPTDGATMVLAPEWLERRLTTPPAAREARRPKNPDVKPGARPADRWMARIDWAQDLLKDVGAEFIDGHTSIDGSYYETWARPGCMRDHGELHAGATLYYGGSDVLKVFTSGWPGLAQEETYDKLAFLRTTRFGGSLEQAVEWIKDEEFKEAMRDLDRRKALLAGDDAYGVDAAGTTPTRIPFESGGEATTPVAPEPSKPAPVDGGDGGATPPADNPPTKRWERPAVAVNDQDQLDFVTKLRVAWDDYNGMTCSAPHRDTNPLVYRRGGEYVRIRNESGRPVLDVVDAEIFRAESMRGVRFVRTSLKFSKDGGDPRVVSTDCFLPREMARAYLADRDAMTTYELDEICRLPIMSPDGSFHHELGYEAHGRKYLSERFPEAPEAPTDEELEHAKAVLFECFDQFPFDRPADFANTVALFLTPLIRTSLRAGQHVPMCLINAHAPGTGKTKMATLVSIVALGAPGGNQVFPEDEAEVEKRFTAMLLEGTPLATFDNINHRLDSTSLVTALTTDVWSGRLLGQSKQVKVPIRMTFIATGNNIEVSREAVRRFYQIQLDTHGEAPEKRIPPGGWKHDDLEAWVTDHRHEIVVAMMTLVRAWATRGRPLGTATKGGSFDRWSRLMGGILAVADIEGFLDNDDEFRANAAPDEMEFGAYYEALFRVFGSSQAFTVNSVLDLTEVDDEEGRYGFPKDQELRDTLPEAVTRRRKAGRESMATSLGIWHRKKEGDFYGGFVVSKVDTKSQGRTHYVIRQASVAAEGLAEPPTPFVVVESPAPSEHPPGPWTRFGMTPEEYAEAVRIF